MMFHAVDDATKIAMLKVHLPYELDMGNAFALLPLLHDGKYLQDGPVRNALIEAFWLHARNVIEFLTNQKRNKTPSGVASARDFTDSKFSPDHEIKKIFKKIRAVVNVQITHLKYERRSSPQEKLGGYDMIRVKQAIDSQIAQFEQHLLPKYKVHWSRRAPNQHVLVGDTPQSTNAKLEVTNQTSPVQPIGVPQRGGSLT